MLNCFVCLLLGLGVEGYIYIIRSVDRLTSVGIYECFIDNAVKPPVLAKIRVDVLCEL